MKLDAKQIVTEERQAEQIQVNAEDEQRFQNDVHAEMQAAKALEEQCLSFMSTSKPVRVASLDVFKKK